ncbi:uncharacterized protein LOC118199667 [Stegodyphus dumicola]|uniref:uncharacterized protein LOC118199667 n=1 Tax=Stegodyphus dumicola TaxID=202533 RepID=UPI0015AF5968|nr:uncharacterized protein LOC118199667 [Stegodyphus dumicola]
MDIMAHFRHQLKSILILYHENISCPKGIEVRNTSNPGEGIVIIFRLFLGDKGGPPIRSLHNKVTTTSALVAAKPKSAEGHRDPTRKKQRFPNGRMQERWK